MEGLKFPENFKFGTATSAYQIEGAYNQDGKGESIWDRFTHINGRTAANGDVAINHYNLFREDVKLLKEVGIESYRYSIAWTRIFPDGKGKINKKGVEFYKELTDLLVENNISPVVTLNHWDLPQKLQDIGGWTNRDTAKYFAEYASVMYEALGGKPTHFATHNEPWVIAYLGNHYGRFAPGLRDFSAALLVSHNLLLGHGMAVKNFRDSNTKGKIGIVIDLQYSYPKTNSEEDKFASERSNQAHHTWFADPILKGEYPKLMVDWFKSKPDIVMPEIKPGDLEIISQPIDYLGLNYYYPYYTSHSDGEDYPIEKHEEGGIKNYDANGLLDLLKRLHEDYNGIEIIITENGYPDDDEVEPDGQIIDDERIKYISDHIMACKKAIDMGINLTGYHQWAFFDTYEWNDFGRLGFVYVDFKTLKRTLKKSAYFYKDLIKKCKG